MHSSTKTNIVVRLLLGASLLVAGLGASHGVSNAAGGLQQVAAPAEGSSDPTQFASNRRVAVTSKKRVLVVHGLHYEGVQLKWRDPGEPWRKKTTGAVAGGTLLRDTGTGDWTASIATAKDGRGREHAWVVWSGWSATGAREAQMRRLTNVNSPDGPKVGPVIPIASAGTTGSTGNAKIDVAFEKTSSGRRGVIAWQRRTGASAWEITTAWFTSLGTAQPSIHHRSTLFSGSSASTVSTLATSPSGMNVVVRDDEGNLGLYTHNASDGLTDWNAAPAGSPVGSDARPSAAVLDNGETLGVAEDDGQVTIQRWGVAGIPTVDLDLAGYRHPSITSNGVEAWVVMVRMSDGRVVMRKMTGTIWGGDTVLIGAEGGGDHEWPNAAASTDGQIRFIVRGPAHDEDQSSVLFVQRRV